MAEPETGIEGTRLAIMSRLETASASGSIRGVKVVRGQIDDGERVPTDDDGRMVPYICVVFGGRGKMSMGQRGIVTSRQDLQRFVFGVECYGLDAAEVDRLADRVEDILEGYEPPDAGQVSAINSGRIENPADVKQNHSRDGIGLLFECYVGTITPVLL